MGLAYVVDILCGVMAGGLFQHNLISMEAYPESPSLTGHMMIAINPLAVLDKEEFQERMAEFVNIVHDTAVQPGAEPLLLPGERAYRTEQARRAVGIPLPPPLYAELAALGAEFGVAMPA